MGNLPEYHPDIYADEGILDPYPHYRALRELGAAVWLPAHSVWAISRYDDVRAALRDHDGFSSASGVAVGEAVNRGLGGTTLASDPPLHDKLRKLVAAPMTVGALNLIKADIAAAAHAVVDRLVARGRFDAATDLAQHLPLTIVSQLVGLPEAGRANMLPYAAGVFDMLGPENARSADAMPVILEMRGLIAALTRDTVKPGSWAARLLDHVDAGTIAPEQFPVLLRDYLGPSLDTTIFATSSLIWLFAQNSDQWDLLRAEPKLIRNAINEAIRIESPIRGFTRVLTRDRVIGGTPLPAGARVLLLFASANRDDRKWHEPEVFDIRRKVGDHLGFGFGIHSCAGMHLARLEIELLLEALVARVRRFEAGAPTRAINNTLRGYASLPVTVVC